MRVGHEQIIRDGVVAAGAAQAAGVPGVEDLQFGARHGGDAQRRPVRAGAAIVEHASREQPPRVRDAAAEGPASGDTHAAIDGNCLAARGPHAGGDHPGVAEDLGGALLGEVGGEQAAGGGDRDAPARRRVAPGDALGAAKRGRGRCFERAQRGWHPGAHEPGRPQLLEQRRWQRALALGRGGQLAGESRRAAGQSIELRTGWRAGRGSGRGWH